MITKQDLIEELQDLKRELIRLQNHVISTDRENNELKKLVEELKREKPKYYGSE